MDVESQEYFYRYIVKLFKIKPIEGEKITYWKFRNSTHLKQKSGIFVSGLAYSSLKRIWSIRSWENHELIHILQFNYLGWSTAFFNEGLAVAFQVDPLKKYFTPYIKFAEKMTPLNQYLKTKIKEKKYIKLEKIITTKGFRAFLGEHEIIAYIEAGSFVRYLIDKYGLAKFFQLLRVTHRDNWILSVKIKLLQVYNLSLETLEKQWLDFLKGDANDTL